MKRSYKSFAIGATNLKKSEKINYEWYICLWCLFIVFLTHMEKEDPGAIEQLQTNMQGLLAELSDLSNRNDELMSEKDLDLNAIRELENQVKEYRRKYEQAKTEIRSVKGTSIYSSKFCLNLSYYAATSQLLLQMPQLDAQLPMAADGGILDIHVTAFLSAIDSLLTAGRSNSPTRVLSPMKSVINAVTAIINDVQAFESRPSRDRSEEDTEALCLLRERATATLTNLAAAAQ